MSPTVNLLVDEVGNISESLSADSWATETSGGSAPCGDFKRMEKEIARLRQEGYLRIPAFHYYKYYGNDASERMKADFGRMVKAGAAIVNDSQAHAPKTMDFLGGNLVHYGLGNLFFDQMTVRSMALPLLRRATSSFSGISSIMAGILVLSC